MLAASSGDPFAMACLAASTSIGCGKPESARDLARRSTEGGRSGWGWSDPATVAPAYVACGPYDEAVFVIILLLFLAVPIVEIYLVVQVGSSLGVLPTIALLVLISTTGAWLLRHQGLSVLARIQSKLAHGEMPGKELVDGLLIVFAGALILTPGFMTDGFGIFLMLPPTRAIVRIALMRRFGVRVASGGGSYGPDGFSRWGGPNHVGDFWVSSDDDQAGNQIIELQPPED